MPVPARRGRRILTKKWLVPALCLLVLCACAKQPPTPDSVRAHFEALAGFNAHVKILSDFGQSALEYELDYAYNKESSDHLTITAPASVAGIEATIAGEDSFVLQYGGAALEDGMPDIAGVTPAGCVYWLMRELRESEPLETWSETVNDIPALVLRYESTDGDTVIMRQVWLAAESLQPLCAEIYVDGSRALQLTFSEYQETAGAAVPQEEQAVPETGTE